MNRGNAYRHPEPGLAAPLRLKPEGLEPPSGYPGPDPQPCHPGVRYLQIVRQRPGRARIWTYSMEWTIWMLLSRRLPTPGARPAYPGHASLPPPPSRPPRRCPRPRRRRLRRRAHRVRRGRLEARGRQDAPHTPAPPPGPPAAPPRRAVVKPPPPALATFLVDGHGRPLSRSLKNKGRRSRCSGACAQNWPPQTTSGRPHAAGRAKASRLSTSRRAGGARQVDYAGHPLYRFSLDSGPGTTSGQGIEAFGGRWYVVAPSGRAITKTPSDGY